jgi:hypothetical protein
MFFNIVDEGSACVVEMKERIEVEILGTLRA